MSTTYPPLPFVPPLVPGEPVPVPSALQQALDRVFYPESDGKPMAENTLQYGWIETIKGNLDALYADRDDVFVAGYLLWYPVEGESQINAAPDTMVVLGRPKRHRGSYLQWREGGVAPQVVWEVLSPSNTVAELDAKRFFYERYGVLEYCQFDPHGGGRRGWWRENTRQPFRRIERLTGWVSPLLGVRFDADPEGKLVLRYPDGRPFVNFVTLDKQRQQAEEAAQIAEEAARIAEEAARQAETERDAKRAARERLEARLRALGIDPDAPSDEEAAP